MKFSGLNGTLAKHLSYRLSKEGDVFANGDEIDERYIVIVHKKDCPVYEKNNHKYIDPSEAPAISDMTGHSTTKMVYGCIKKRKAGENKGVKVVDDNRQTDFIYDEEYFTTNVYFGSNGRVYRASLRRKNTPQMRARFEVQEIENKEKRELSYLEDIAIQLQHKAIDQTEHDRLAKRFNEINS
jgi:hypothetical protein